MAHRTDHNWPPDFRRRSKTNTFCAHCQRDLKPGQPRRWVHVIEGGAAILPPGDEALFPKNDRGDMGFFPVGMDCARTVGLDWTTPDDQMNKTGAA